MVTNPKLAEGKEVSLPCLIAPGAFSTERFIKVDAEADNKPLPITGFVPIEFLNDPSPDSKDQRDGHVSTHLRFASDHHVALLFPGELLSATNPVRVSLDWFLKVSNGKQRPG